MNQYPTKCPSSLIHIGTGIPFLSHMPCLFSRTLFLQCVNWHLQIITSFKTSRQQNISTGIPSLKGLCQVNKNCLFWEETLNPSPNQLASLGELPSGQLSWKIVTVKFSLKIQVNLYFWCHFLKCSSSYFLFECTNSSSWGIYFVYLSILRSKWIKQVEVWPETTLHLCWLDSDLSRKDRPIQIQLTERSENGKII